MRTRRYYINTNNKFLVFILHSLWSTIIIVYAFQQFHNHARKNNHRGHLTTSLFGSQANDPRKSNERNENENFNEIKDDGPVYRSLFKQSMNKAKYDSNTRPRQDDIKSFGSETYTSSNGNDNVSEFQDDQMELKDETMLGYLTDQEDLIIDSFLRGEYDRPFSDDASSPHPKLSPKETVDKALTSLRELDEPYPSHGAAIFMRFCAPLSRNDRWGGGVAGSNLPKSSSFAWKELMRGALTPTMLARRIRASQDFSILLDWRRLDVTEGMAIPNETGLKIGVGSTIAFVNAALFFGDGIEPSIIQFTLRKFSGVWLIDTAVVSKKEWFTHKISDDNSL